MKLKDLSTRTKMIGLPKIILIQYFSVSNYRNKFDFQSQFGKKKIKFKTNKLFN